MQLKFMILIALSIMCVASARIVCQVDYCARVDCALVEKDDCEVNQDGIFVTHGGWCGCCPTCLNKIREGESCWSLRLVGTPPRAACDTGLTCDPKTNVCTKQ